MDGKCIHWDRFTLLTSKWVLFVFAAFCLERTDAISWYPSTRRLYYLHTQPATWSSARDTCAKYQGKLLTFNEASEELVKADLRTLDEVLEDWNGAFSGLTTNVWTGLYKYADGAINKLRWHGCVDENSLSDYSTLTSSTSEYCLSMESNTNPATAAAACNSKLPFVCHIDAGQCWFWPLEHKKFSAGNSLTSSSFNVDLNTCAQLCRNTTSGTDKECWAFTVGDDCILYFSKDRHHFLLNSNYFETQQDSTIYLKVCTGGETTPMPAVTNVNLAIPEAENCSGSNGGSADWLDTLCYCDCDEPPVILEPEDMVLTVDEKVEKIVEELIVDPGNTSAAYRKLNSAEDERQSAKSLGAMGIAMLSLVFGGLVLLDLNVLVAHIKYLLTKTGSLGPDNANVKQT